MRQINNTTGHSRSALNPLHSRYAGNLGNELPRISAVKTIEIANVLPALDIQVAGV